MAIANLHEILVNFKLRKSAINLEISQLQAEQTLATYAQADKTAIKAKDEEGVRQYFKALYEDGADLQLQYKDYTQIPDFEEEMDKIAAKYQDEMAQLTAWETALKAQITTDSAELAEITAYEESYKQMLQSNISDDFNNGLD